MKRGKGEKGKKGKRGKKVLKSKLLFRRKKKIKKNK
jgi:hypothetical protein